MQMKKILFIALIGLSVFLGACKKKEPEPTPPIIPTQSYTSQVITSSVSLLSWVIDGDTLELAPCSPDYSVGEYHASFNFAIGVEYDFKIIKAIIPWTGNYELKNEGTIKFIDGYSNTSAYGGVNSYVITQGATWTYPIFYGQCGSIQNQLSVQP
jgi:hypothetical protein